MVPAIFDFIKCPDSKSTCSESYDTTNNHVNKMCSVVHPKYITESVKITKIITVKIISPTPAQITQAGIGSYL